MEKAKIVRGLPDVMGIHNLAFSNNVQLGERHFMAIMESLGMASG